MSKDNYQNKATLPDQEFGQVLQLIRQTRQNLFAQANTTLMELYWHIGKIISEKVRSAAWGKGVVTALADYIARTDPDVKGFSDKNLWRMKQFYETYCNDEKLSPLVRELSWTQNTIIFSRCKSPEAREFYLTLAHKDKLNKRELERQIDAAQFERWAMGGQKLSSLQRELPRGES